MNVAAVAALGVLLFIASQRHQVVEFDVPESTCTQTCQAAQRAQQVRQAVAEVRAQVKATTAGRVCWTDGRSRIPKTLVVHAAGTSKVREVSFAAGLKAAAAGRVWVDAKCA